MRIKVVGDTPRLCPRFGRWLHPGTVLDVAEEHLPSYYLFCEPAPDEPAASVATWVKGAIAQVTGRGPKPKYTCTVCHAGFHSPEGLEMHMISTKDPAHQQGRLYAQLLIANIGDDTEITHKGGKSFDLKGLKPTTPGPEGNAVTYSCPWCEAPNFKNAQGVARHLRTAHREHYPDLPADDLTPWVEFVEARQQAGRRLV